MLFKKKNTSEGKSTGASTGSSPKLNSSNMLTFALIAITVLFWIILEVYLRYSAATNIFGWKWSTGGQFGESGKNYLQRTGIVLFMATMIIPFISSLMVWKLDKTNENKEAFNYMAYGEIATTVVKICFIIAFFYYHLKESKD